MSDCLEQNRRRIILPSIYAEYGPDTNPRWKALPLSDVERESIAALIDASTVPLTDADGTPYAREVAPHAFYLFDPLQSGFIPDALDEVDALWSTLLQSGEVQQVTSFVGRVSAHRQFIVLSPRGASLVHLYAAFAYRQTFRTCLNCDATFASGHKISIAFCSEKCRARVADVDRRARLAAGGGGS